MAGEPHLTCQHCKCRLVLGDAETPLRLSGTGSGLSSKALDESFMMLEEAAAGRSQQQQTPPPGGGTGGAGPSGTTARRLDESFMVLQGGPRSSPSASAGAQSAMLDTAPSTGGGGLGAASSSGAASGGVQRIPFDARLRALARVYEVAGEEARLELPLCTECAGDVHRELEAQLAELQQEVAAYESALARLESAAATPQDDRRFQEQLAAAQGHVQYERERLAHAECQLAAAQADLAAAEAQSAELTGQEERYWHTFNEFQLRLQEHLEERDAVAARLESATSQLAGLRRTSVYHDVFRIWFDGSCGTISGLRLGRTAQQAVEWEEINAAWGQAVLLLASLARGCGLRFRAYRLLPQGSYPQVAEVARGSGAGAVHDLYGPVSKFLCHSYDKAQAGFLACLQELADWLVARGASDGQGNRFALPCPIEGDKVAGLTIRLLFNKDKNWTRALKHMLVDLKFVLKFALVLMDSRPAHVAALQREGHAGSGGAGAGAGGGAEMAATGRRGS